MTLMLTPPPETNGGGKRGGKKGGSGGVKLVATLNLVDLVCSMIEALYVRIICMCCVFLL